MMRGARWAGVLVCLAAPAAPARAQDTATAKPRMARITYLTSATAYVDAGRLDGLREATRVEVVRGGAAIGVLRVAFLASHQAACDILSASAALVVGDSVRFVPVATPRDSSGVVRAASTPKPSRTHESPLGLRGRVGVQYFVVRQRDGTDGGFSQPSLDVRLDGAPTGAPSLTLAADVRARRTYTILPDGSAVTDGRNRVYQAAFSLNAPGSPTRVTVGRQISGGLGPVGLFDGVMAELHQPTWGSGLFAGSQPEPVGLGFSSSIVELGGYAQRRSRPGASVQWSLTLGASGSYQDAHANREFGFLQGSYLSRRLSAFLTQEVDYYRPWKVAPGMHVVSPTSTFATVQYRATNGLTVHAGFDNRRNVLLYRDVVNPVTTFDDTYRQGVWAGMWLQVGRRNRLGVEVRQSSGGSVGNANSYTLSLGTDRLTVLALTARVRSTYYTNPQVNGWLQSAALGFAPGTRLHLELNGGVRTERGPLADPTLDLVTWVGADLDLTIARAWYTILSVTRQRGGIDGSDALYGGLSFRF